MLKRGRSCVLLVRGGLTALQLCVGAMTFDPLYFVGGFAFPDTLEINTINLYTS